MSVFSIIFGLNIYFSLASGRLFAPGSFPNVMSSGDEGTPASYHSRVREDPHRTSCSLTNTAYTHSFILDLLHDRSSNCVIFFVKSMSLCA